jgi:polyferredoxin
VFVLSLGLVLLLWFGLGYRVGAVGRGAAYWFVAGNLLYWSLGVGLAVALRDNRAFCKYLYPNAGIFKQTVWISLLKVSGDARACLECPSQACLPMCPMDIRIPDYIPRGQQVLLTACIQCQVCVCICLLNTLKLSAGLDLGGEDRVQTREFVAAWRDWLSSRRRNR